MSMSDLYPSGPEPDPFLILAGLADVVMDHLAAAAGCADCRTLGKPCLDHRAGAELARDCRVLYAAVAWPQGALS